MGLFCTFFAFPAGSPTAEDVGRAVRAALTETVMLAGALVRSPLQEMEAKQLAAEAVSLVIAGAKVEITLVADRRLRRRRDIVVTISPFGPKWIVTGSGTKLLTAVCEGMKSLGGAEMPIPDVVHLLKTRQGLAPGTPPSPPR